MLPDRSVTNANWSPPATTRIEFVASGRQHRATRSPVGRDEREIEIHFLGGVGHARAGRRHRGGGFVGVSSGNLASGAGHGVDHPQVAIAAERIA